MDYQEYIVNDIHTVIAATTDKKGLPVTCAIDIMDCDDDGLYFLTAKGLWQCSEPCCNETFDNESAVRAMVKQQQNMKIPDCLIPRCPHCGKPMAMNLRCDDSFVQDEGWYAAAERYEEFIRRHKNLHILFLELGVGFNTPGIIKYPFMQMTARNPKAVYACVNMNEAYAPRGIGDRAVCVDGDIGDVIESCVKGQT